uniref:SHSP domain-containing protein n=1 Tax=Panagrolaimus davidi TaxID=227884 RepID=A0A914PU56_9BILA
MAIFIHHPISRRCNPRFIYGDDPFEEEEHPILAWNHRPSFIPTPPMIVPDLIPSIAKTVEDSIKNENGKFEIKCSIPGFLPEELKLDMDGDKLILTGEKKTSTSFQRIERIFCIPSGVKKETIKCEFDPTLNQLCIEAVSPNSPKINSSIESKNQESIETKKETSVYEEPMEITTTTNTASESQSTINEDTEGSKSPEAIKGKDYIERETDEGIEIDTTVSAS